jgi:hypothetical protein
VRLSNGLPEGSLYSSCRGPWIPAYLVNKSMRIGGAPRDAKEAHYSLLREQVAPMVCKLQKDIPSVLEMVECNAEHLSSAVVGFHLRQATKRDQTT